MCFIRSDKGLGLNTSNASVLKKRHLEDVFLRNVHWPLSSSGMSSEQRFHPPPKKKKKEDRFKGEGEERKKIWRRSNYTKEIQQANVQREEVRHVFEKHFLVEL